MKPPLFIASSTEGLGIAYAVQSNLQDSTAPTVWDQGAFQPSSAHLESLIQSLDRSKFGVFIFSNDDVVRIREREQFAPRDNVVFEMGLFVGRLGRERNFIVQPDNASLRLPTDLLGVVSTTFDATRPPTEYRAALGPACHEIRLAIQRLMAYDLTGGDNWHAGCTVLYSSLGSVQVSDFIAYGDRFHGQGPDKPKAQGAFSIEARILAVRRTNTSGRYIVGIRQYKYGGALLDHIPPNEFIAGDRRFRISFEAKSTKGTRTVVIVLKDNLTEARCAEQAVDVSSNSWQRSELELRVKPSVGCYVRIEDKENAVAESSLHIRTLVVSEVIS